MRKTILLVLSLLALRISVAQVQPSFVATISFGIQVPVYVYDGKSSAYEFSFNALNNNENQGILIILGRDSKSIWYIQAGWDNDASEEGYFMNLARIDTIDSVKVFPAAVNKKDTTDAMRFQSAFASLFKKHKLEKLTPVEAWAPPEPYYFVAQVNSRELNKCFTWNFHVDSEDNGTCVFYFDWGVQAMPFQQTREVIFTNCKLTIPHGWTSFPGDEYHGYVAYAGDTLRYSRYAAIMRLPIEMMEYKYLAEDSLDAKRNAEVRAYNDTLRMKYPMMLTHDETHNWHGDTTVHTLFPKPGITGRMMMEVHMNGESFVLTTTELTPAEQSVFRKVMESWELW